MEIKQEMTNLENISKNPEILAKVIAYEDGCNYCCNKSICEKGKTPKTTCKDGILKWLKSKIKIA